MTEPIVLVTGASGFVGRAVVAQLLCNGIQVRTAVRNRCDTVPSGAHVFGGLDLDSGIDWSMALRGVRVVIHCAARAHVVRETSTDPLTEFRRVNVEGTRTLALRAASAGVKRIVFISSIGVNGSETYNRPFQAEDAPAPQSPYACSKLEAELALMEVSAGTGIEPVIVRPPLVYGPDAPGNFRTLIRAVCRGMPLPFGAIRNRRSLVALDNLVSLLVLCIQHPSAAGQIFLISDDEDVSTPSLLRRMAVALGRRPRLLPVPASLLRTVALALGKASLAQSLCGSLQVDIAKTRQVLGWSPVISMDEALARTGQHYLRSIEHRN